MYIVSFFKYGNAILYMYCILTSDPTKLSKEEMYLCK